MYDIVFIGNESDQWSKLKQRFKIAKRADSFEQAKSKVLTKMFWAVWPDIEICDDFDFSFDVDEWDQKYTHSFMNGDYSDGVMLFPKDIKVTADELKCRVFKETKQVDIIASTPIPFDLYYIDSWNEYEQALENSSTEMFWAVSRNLKYDQSYINNFYFDHNNRYDREENHAFIHDVDGRKLYNGVFLCSKNKPIDKNQIEYRFLENAKQWDDVVSGPRLYDIRTVFDYAEYLDCLDNTETEMFWMIPTQVTVDADFAFDMYFSHDNDYDRKINHVFKNGEYYDGVVLCSKHAPISEREFNYRFITNKKEHDIVASVPHIYEQITVSSYEEFSALRHDVTTNFFYVVPTDVDVTWDFKYQIPYHERENIHVFKNGKYHDGVFLIHRDKPLSKREFDYRFFVNKKEIDIEVSKPKPYDVVFISYKEPDADKNYKSLKEKAPNAKRIHGVKGIHQAHIEAAKLCSTDMIWIVDGDAILVDEFELDHQVPKWKRDHVFVWRSKNPINDLVYGYGGIKLFPRKQTLEMDTSKPDMTTSISSKFNAMEKISNITAFNTGPFETWKSAFRECAKLASKVIERQKDDETNERLKTWTTIGSDRRFGEYAIRGATAGMEFGLSRRDDLRLINDFDWLEEQFNADT